MASTFIVQTHNVWGDHWAQERRESLRAFYTLRAPDLLATQELRPWSRDIIDSALPSHARVQDEGRGWSHQSNLWWNTEIFTLVEHGSEDVGILDDDAYLFWARLRTAGEREVIFATAHLTWPGHQDELATRVNQRTGQAEKITAKLDELAGSGADVIFTTDINDIGPPVWQFGNSGYLDTFTALERHCPPTHPVIPSGFSASVATGKSPIASPPKAIDWIFLRGGLQARVSEVAEFFHEGVAPSDHYPVVSAVSMS